MKSPDQGFYIALVLLLSAVELMVIDPNKGVLWKWAYWFVIPSTAVLLLCLAFDSLIGGLVIGSIFVAMYAGGYFRYKL